jgi:ankyrin repeat protein
LGHAVWSQAETVAYLLNVGIKPVADNDGWPPISAPIQMAREDIFFKLIKAYGGKGLDGPSGLNMLHLCARYGQVSMAKHLVNFEGLKPDATDDVGWTPLHYAALSGQLDTFEYFAELSGMAATTKLGYTALHIAAANGRVGIIEYLLRAPSFRKHLSDKDNNGATALHAACLNSDHETVRLLLQALDSNEKLADASPLHLALHKVWNRGSSVLDDATIDLDAVFATVSVLLADSRTDPNVTDKDGDTPLALAANVNKIQRALLHHDKLDPNQPISTGGGLPIGVAATLHEWEVLRRWVDRDIKFATGPIGKSGNTLLHLLVGNDAPEDLIETILENVTAADLNAFNEGGNTPLMVAIEEKKWALVRQFLSQNDLDPALRGVKARTALMLALQNGADRDTLGQLVSVSPSLLTARDYFGWTPLHRAMAYQQLESIDWLIQPGNDPATLWSEVDNVGRHPADLASPFLRETLKLDEPTSACPAPKSWDSDLEWKPLKTDRREKLLHLIQNEDKLNFEDAEIHTASLSFFPAKAVQIIRMQLATRSADNEYLYYLKHRGQTYRLKGTSPPIHEVNAKAAIKLNRDNVLDYLRYFCFFVRGEEGPFLIAEGVEQKEIPQFANETAENLRKVLRPAYFNGFNEKEDKFYAMASVYYGNAIFLADFEIAEAGMILMICDYPVLADLSAKVSQPLG